MIKLNWAQLLKPVSWIQIPLDGRSVWNCRGTIVVIAGLFLVVAGMFSAFFAGDCFAQPGDENNRSHLKKRILVQGQGGRYIQTGGILQYFEDSASGLHSVLNVTRNAEIEQKDFFEIASKGEDPIMARPAEIIPVPFVTLRNRTQSTEPSEYFGGKRGQMHAGVCNVSLSPIWMLDEIAGAAPFYIPDEKIDLVDIKETQLEHLARDIGSFSKKNTGNIVIYIHGYNVDFEKGCKRSAIFQRALGLGDRLILFSWPADGKMLKYTWDEADLEWSVPHMARFFEDVGKWVGDGKLDIVAHSLGSRGVLQALVRMAYCERVAPLLQELVFIAPDIDADVFRQELPLIQKIASHITVYASENDKPLKLSHEVHGAPRLGQAGEYLTVLEGVETVDISNINNRRYSGHLYHLFTPEVIADLTRLLHTGEPTSRRPALQPESRDGLPYWRMVPAD